MGEICNFQYTLAWRNTYGKQRYRCQEPDCPTKPFMLKYRYQAYEPGIKEQVIDMAHMAAASWYGAGNKIDKNTVSTH